MWGKLLCARPPLWGVQIGMESVGPDQRGRLDPHTLDSCMDLPMLAVPSKWRMSMKALLVLKFRIRLHAELKAQWSTCLRATPGEDGNYFWIQPIKSKNFAEEGILRSDYKHSNAERLLNIGLPFQISPTNEVCLCSPFPATREILSSRRRTSSKPLLSKRRDREERRENESLRPREHKILGMEGKGREERTS
jgi:hypothetical protein